MSEVNSLDFEKKIEKAKELLEKLMSPDITLENSVKFYESGIKELNEASKMLEQAKLRYEEIKKEGLI
ncbi:MAG: exodeoxyribonuclease VII small subunit [Campylobacterales bacterium]|nr:exodeoxyribonuclease VII small subunit [Campylobacterales bacterium]